MIQGIGVDIVSIDRFKHWHEYSLRSLGKIFSQEEIAYCKAVSVLSAHRFAARFAAREALYKALYPMIISQKISFFSLSRSVSVLGAPPRFVIINNHELFNNLTIHLSLSHEGGQAIAMVIVECGNDRLS